MHALPSHTSNKAQHTLENQHATTAYFIIEKPRLGETEYSRIIREAKQNSLQTYKVFYYEGEEKLRIFYYQKEMDV